MIMLKKFFTNYPTMLCVALVLISATISVKIAIVFWLILLTAWVYLHGVRVSRIRQTFEDIEQRDIDFKDEYDKFVSEVKKKDSEHVNIELPSTGTWQLGPSNKECTDSISLDISLLVPPHIHEMIQSGMYKLYQSKETKKLLVVTKEDRCFEIDGVFKMPGLLKPKPLDMSSWVRVFSKIELNLPALPSIPTALAHSPTSSYTHSVTSDYDEDYVQAIKKITKDYIKAAVASASFSKGEDGIWFAEHPDLPGVLACGKTLKECKKQLPEVIEGWIEVRKKRGLLIPSLQVKQAPKASKKPKKKIKTSPPMNLPKK